MDTESVECRRWPLLYDRMIDEGTKFLLVEILDQSIEYLVRVGFKADVVVPSERGVDSAYLVSIEGLEAHFVQDRLSI